MDVNAVCLPVVLYCVLSRAVQWNTVQGVVLHCCRAVACSAQLCFALLSRVAVFAGAGGGSAQRAVLKKFVTQNFFLPSRRFSPLCQPARVSVREGVSMSMMTMRTVIRAPPDFDVVAEIPPAVCRQDISCCAGLGTGLSLSMKITACYRHE